MAKPPNPKNRAQLLYDLANHFARKDWEYTRLHDIKRLVRTDEKTGYYTLGKRLKRAAHHLFFGWQLSKSLGRDKITESWPWHKRLWAFVLDRFYGVKIIMQGDRNNFDGMLSSGVYAYWEEDMEYIQMVQPSVGSLVAEFLMAEPSNPHAIKINAELDRIQRNYAKRVKEGLVDGQKREE